MLPGCTALESSHKRLVSSFSSLPVTVDLPSLFCPLIFSQVYLLCAVLAISDTDERIHLAEQTGWDVSLGATNLEENSEHRLLT